MKIKDKKMIECPICKGKGKLHCKSTTYGTDEVVELDIDCYLCDGEKEISEQKYKDYEAEKELWCECEESTFGSYPQDGECSCGIYKHHVHCGKCGKISQIG